MVGRRRASGTRRELEPTMFRSLDHVNVCTKDLAATRAFYVDALGLTEGPRPSFGADGLWLYAGGAPIVHIVLETQARPPRGGIDHFAFAVADFDAALARMTAAGIPYAASDIPDGFGRQAFITDPNGVSVELNWRG
jgi:catechol 2,3-dioxygenase-like lactoylglutathione lyase family enzyme